jgi:hypothetical protein
MHGFDDDIPLEQLVDQTVWWVCFSESSARICFKNGDEIRIEYLLEVGQSNGMSFDELKWFLIGLPQKEVIGFLVDSRRAKFTFTEGLQLVLEDDHEDIINFHFKIGSVDYPV